jgi:TnpA family transposase
VNHIGTERVEVSQLAVDTHGYTDFAMALSRLMGFDLCPRLRELRQRHLFLPCATTRSAASRSCP